MAADNITLPREQLMEAAAWLFAFSELFEEVEEVVPPSLGGKWMDTAYELTNRLAGMDLGDLDEDGWDRHPLHVELRARALELAAGMLRHKLAENDVEGDQYPLTYYGSPLTIQGFRKCADSLAAKASLTREQGTIDPRMPQHAS